MQLHGHFQASTLTPGQAEFVRRFEAFIQNDTSVFILRGYAGTGKTFLLGGITDWLAARHLPFHRIPATPVKCLSRVGHSLARIVIGFYRVARAFFSFRLEGQRELSARYLRGENFATRGEEVAAQRAVRHPIGKFNGVLRGALQVRWHLDRIRHVPCRSLCNVAPHHHVEKRVGAHDLGQTERSKTKRMVQGITAESTLFQL